MTGASYGGYMMNWMNGHTDRFKCFVNHCGIFSLRSLFYSTEEIYFPGNNLAVLDFSTLIHCEQNGNSGFLGKTKVLTR